MIQQISQNQVKEGILVCKNSEVRICIICGCDKIESFEFGISCEECGSLLER